MPLRSTRLCAAVLLGASAALASCDSEPAGPDSVEFQGVTYVALGNADLRLRGGALEVNQVGASGMDGVRVDAPDGSLDTLNVAIRPLDFGAGAQWGITVYGDVGGVRTSLGRVWAEDIGGGRNSIQAEVAGGFGIDSLVFDYLLGGVLVARSPALPIGTPRWTVLTSAGTTDAGPESVHATREGGVVVIGTDYRSEGLSGGGAPGVGCTAALIQVPFQPTPVCADFVRARPLLPATGGVLPAAGSAEIQGRSIGSFAIVSGDVE
jgi:hypothetical protein